MNYLEAFYLALIQGLTEFLPISSSAHLILLSEYLGSNQNLFYDISLHLGTLFAVCIYFKNDLKQMLYSFTKDRSPCEQSTLSAISYIFATYVDTGIYSRRFN